MSPAPLKVGTTSASFQDEGKIDSARQKLNSLDRTDEISGQHFFKPTTGILSGPEALLISRFTMIPATFLGVMTGSLMEVCVRR